MGGVDSTDDEKEDGDSEATGCGRIVPPPYAETSSSFGPLERATEEGGNDNAAFHPFKPRTTQTDTNLFLDPRRGRGVE